MKAYAHIAGHFSYQVAGPHATELVAFMAAGVATIVLLIPWLVTHPQAVHHHTAEIVGDAIIGDSRWMMRRGRVR
jgi:hypothetical protein